MTRKKREIGEPEWSHIVPADKVGNLPLKLSISPNADQKKRLAKRLGVRVLDEAQADLVLSRDKGGMVIFASGQVKATVTQDCIITGKPLKNEIADTLEAWYADPEQAVFFLKAKQERLTREGAGEMPVLDESEDPEPITDGQIDVGELAAQYLSLAVDPYPRAEGAEYEGGEKLKQATGEVYENPFAALKDWKQRQDGGEG